MENEEKRHKGYVVGMDSDRTLRVELNLDDNECGGCALAGLCSSTDSKKSSIVKVCLPPGVDHIEPASEVELVVRKGGTLEATVILLLIPFAVFLAVAVAGTLLDWGQALTGILALIAAFVSYPIIRLFHPYSTTPVWRIVSVISEKPTDKN